MVSITKIQEYGNQLAVIMSDGSRVLAYPTVGGLWIVSGEHEPPDPDPPVGVWKYPFSSAARTPGRNFEPQPSPENFHYGIDYGFPPATAGAEIRNPAPGESIVARSGWEENSWTGAGWMVTLYHGQVQGVETWTHYFHMQAASSLTVNQTIEQDDLIGYVGNTGNSFGAHLHWQINQVQEAWNDYAVDPDIFIPANQ